MHTSFSQRYGPWAVVTGATSGLGRALATEIAAHGLNLILVARRVDELNAVAQELRTTHAVETRIIPLDLSEPNANQRLFAATATDEVGLFIAAAGFGTSGNFLDADLNEELSMLTVNLTAVLQQCHHYGRKLAQRGRGGIILFGSLVGYQGTPRAAHYAATKAYVQTLAEALHVEMEANGVDVMSCAPGPVHSGFAARARMRLGLAEAPPSVARETLRALGKTMTVTPGLISRFLTGSLSLAPRRWRVRILALVMGQMTQHQGQASSLS